MNQTVQNHDTSVADLKAQIEALKAQLAQPRAPQARTGFATTQTGKIMFIFGKRAGEKGRWPMTLEGYHWTELVTAIKAGQFDAFCKTQTTAIKA